MVKALAQTFYDQASSKYNHESFDGTFFDRYNQCPPRVLSLIGAHAA
jgi:hypothetical protein